ncbi:MAG: hypothetical protein ACJA1H_001597 [Glaciecola sp.]
MDEEEDRIFNELTGKALCVYNKLNSSSSVFADAIKKFDPEFPVSHLNFKSSSTLPKNVNAYTYPPSNFTVVIEINENNLARPNLSIARTLIHETIHAEMYRKILSILENGGDLEGLTEAQWEQKLKDSDYGGIYDYYSRYGESGMQHEQMAEHYRTSIVNMLKGFQPGLSQGIYEALAWEGLLGTAAWDALSEAEQKSLQQVVVDFNNNGGEDCN